jgi:uncharacterized membrane protein YdjX (TVP38/TMEM64 family)
LAPRIPPAVNDAIERIRRHGFGTVAVVRLLGFPPAGLVQVACGMSGVPFRSFAAGTLAGMLPWAILMNYFAAGIWRSLSA